MNNKKCKQLRKQSKVIAEQHGMPDLKYGTHETQVRVMRMNSKGLMEPSVETRVTVFIEQCSRLIYQNLKKAFGKGVSV